MRQSRWLVVVGAASGALAVATGAFAAHGLGDLVGPRSVEIFRTGASYHLVHSVVVVLAGFWREAGGSRRLASVAGWTLVAGIVLFSGSLYALALGGPRWLGPVTPLGGVAFILGWLALALSAIRR